jgi:hypothetical protein
MYGKGLSVDEIEENISVPMRMRDVWRVIQNTRKLCVAMQQKF